MKRSYLVAGIITWAILIAAAIYFAQIQTSVAERENRGERQPSKQAAEVLESASEKTPIPTSISALRSILVIETIEVDA